MRRENMNFYDKLLSISWPFLLLITMTACVGFVSLYSAAGGSLEPWAGKQMMRFAIGMAGLIITAMIDIRIWMKFAYVIFGLVVVLLIYVDIKGHTSMGAQRWIDLGFLQLQPSEPMKIAVVLALARFFHGATSEDVKNPLFLIVPLGMLALPVLLVMIQPDLGTAISLIGAAGAMFFLAGVSYWMFLVVGGAALASLPVLWTMMHDYQRKRVMIFMDPESDPLGAGYHITQSKIALGSGGVFGKGFLHGTQSHLNFLPEKQTDFIFTLFTEEWGLVGGLALLALLGLIIAYGYIMAFRCQNQFGRLLCAGIVVNFSLYIFINTGMVMGLLPVVGVPLALVSHGGTVMLSVLFGFGLLMSAHVHRDVKFSRRGLDVV
ncbi:MAG TPA: rod shape-determining protein RodA [Patescibacteria group bacterium]|nr:rod shape-determining protein RodA [Patescibacteria group bacterium]